MNILAEQGTAGNTATHVKQPTRRDWEQAARAATRKVRIAPGIWEIESASHAGRMYRVDLWANTCQCPAARHPSCWHREAAQAEERAIVVAHERAKAAQMRAQLVLLAAQYPEDEGLFYRVVQDYAEEVAF